MSAYFPTPVELTNAPSMQSPAQAMIMAVFVADSLALGAHWIYNTDQIERKIGRIDRLLAPQPDSCHSGKQKGDLTHYGDQALVLLESVISQGGFSPADFSARWQNLFNGYDGYIDKATEATLANLTKGNPIELCGSTSSDLAGAARIAPLVYAYHQEPETLIEAAQLQTAMTHNNHSTIAGAVFLARTACSVLNGVEPIEAMEEALEEGVDDLDLDMRIRGGLDSAGKETRPVIKHFGQMCGIAAAMPGAVHLIATYQDDLETALIENVMAGGDSAARGMATGMILAAHQGPSAIPASWVNGMNSASRIKELLSK